jgi:exosome complex RNA-binding protein Rrp42 (RNase PH superfamily)
MLTNFSENEKEFFRKILVEFDTRIDGREKLTMRNFEIFEDVIPSCFSSLKIRLTDYDKEILITIKGELQNEKSNKNKNDRNDIDIQEDYDTNDSIILNIDSINKIEDIKLKQKIEDQIRKLVLRKLDKNLFFLKDNKGENTNYNWKLYIDVLIFDSVKITYLQIISLAIKKALFNLKLPNLVFFKNEINGLIEYDLAENYENEAFMAKEIYIDFHNKIPDVYVFSLINNNAYLDPNDEEEVNSNSIIIASKLNGKIENIESIGSSVELNKIMEVSNIIKNLGE